MKLKFIIIIIFLSICYAKSEVPNTDSLANLLIAKVKQGEYDKPSKMQYSIIADYYRRTNPFKALNFHYKMIRLGEKYNNDNFRAANYVSIGTIYRDQGLNGRALENFYTAMKFIDDSFHGDYCWLYVFIGNIYFSEQMYDEAIKFYKTAEIGFDSLGYNSEKITDPKDRDSYWSFTGKAVANNNIGLCYQKKGLYDSAMYFFRKGLEFRKKQNHTFGIGHSWIYIGEMYFQKKQYDSALSTYKHALQIIDSAYYNEIGSKLEVRANFARCLYLIGLLFEDKGDINKAELYIKASLDTLINVGDKQSLAFRYLNLAEFFDRNHKSNESIEFAKNALDLSTTYDLYKPALESSYYLSETFKKFKNFDKYSKYQNIYNSIKDTVYEKYNKFSIKEVSTRMENERNLNSLKKERALKEYSIKQQKIIIIILSIFALVVLIGITMFWKKLQIIKRLNNTLEENNLLLKETNIKLSESERNLAIANSDLNSANKHLVKSENNLKDLNATKDKFFSIIAHDLKNPFSSFKNLLELMDKDYDDFSEDEKRDFISEMAKSSRYLYNLLENLLTWSRSQRGKIDFTPLSGNFKQIIDRNIEFLSMNSEMKQIKLISKTNEELFADFDANMMLTVMRNLISNAIKFTPHQGTITVGADIKDKKLIAYVSDTGIGMSQEDIDKLFRIDVNLTSVGTDNEKGTGLGLILCKEFMDMHSGRIWAESEPGKGSVFFIEFPLNKSKKT